MRAVRREREPAADSISVLESAHERNGEVRRFACRGGEEAKCSGWRRGRLVVSTPATSGWVLWRRDGSDRCVWSPRSRQPVALTRSSGGIGCEGVVDDRGGDRLSVCRVDPVGGHRTGAGLPRAFCSSRTRTRRPEGQSQSAPLSSITVPTLVIHGTADPMFPASTSPCPTSRPWRWRGTAGADRWGRQLTIAGRRGRVADQHQRADAVWRLEREQLRECPAG